MSKVLMKGNEAMAEAAIRSGCKLFFGYPITPQTEINAYMSRRMPKENGLYLQAESEIAAINMVLGAAATGARAMTSSSSPGISLKTEGISYIAACDLPCVIVNVQRGGPGLGGIQPAQADYNQATKAPGHGDFHVLVFSPSTVQEMVNCVFDAFDKADEYRMPALILADGLLGQMMEPVEFPEREAVRPAKEWAVTGHGNRRQHNIINSLYLEADILENKILERYKRYEIIEQKESKAEPYLCNDAEIVLIAYGATSRIARSAVDRARNEGVKAGLLKPLTLWPFPEKQIREHTKKSRHILTVEMSMGQMVQDVKCAVEYKIPVTFYGRTGGVVPTPVEVYNEIIKHIGGKR